MSRQITVPFTVAEAAEILRVKPWTVYELCKSGAIKSRKPGKAVLIWPEDLQAYIDGGDTEDVA